ncbi:MAG: GNAT family N-acetyltransferase [Bacteroidota bacterium]
MIHIRAYTEADFEPLLAMIDQHIPAYFHPDEKQDYALYLREKREDYFVLEKDGQLLAGGGINYFPKEKTARLSWDLVDAKAMGQGLGLRLARYRIDHVRKQPTYEQMVVRTSQFAHKFYAKAGFELLRSEKDFWGEGFDLYEMAQTL